MRALTRYLNRVVRLIRKTDVVESASSNPEENCLFSLFFSFLFVIKLGKTEIEGKVWERWFASFKVEKVRDVHNSVRWASYIGICLSNHTCASGGAIVDCQKVVAMVTSNFINGVLLHQIVPR